MFWILAVAVILLIALAAWFIWATGKDLEGY